MQLFASFILVSGSNKQSNAITQNSRSEFKAIQIIFDSKLEMLKLKICAQSNNILIKMCNFLFFNEQSVFKDKNNHYFTILISILAVHFEFRELNRLFLVLIFDEIFCKKTLYTYKSNF